MGKNLNKGFTVRRGFIIGAVTLGGVIFSGCAKLLQKDIDTAKTAIDQAKAAGSDIYAREAYRYLQVSMDSLVLKVGAQKPGFIKQYFLVKEQLDDVTQLARSLRQHTEIRKEELQGEIKSTITEVNHLIETNRLLILDASASIESPFELIYIKSEIDEIEKSINETDTSYKTRDYISALDKVKSAREKVTSINAELSNAIINTKANLKKRA